MTFIPLPNHKAAAKDALARKAFADLRKTWNAPHPHTPAPWCLMPWSKRRYRHEQVAMTIGFTDDYYRDVIMRAGQKRGWT